MIQINNLTTNPIKEDFFKKVAKIILEEELGISQFQKTDLSIALVGQGRIRELNRRYGGKNRPTDVLAFSNRNMGLGEIVICLKEVKKNAKKYGFTFKKELTRILIHGLLHLLDYSHEKKVEIKKMEKKENYYLSKF